MNLLSNHSQATSFFFLHGIFGRGRNWQGFAKKLQERIPEAQCFLLDLKGHGRAPKYDPPHTIQACAEEVASFIASQEDGTDQILIGHSFGGKVALQLEASPPPSLKQIWIIDSNPGIPLKKGDAWNMLVWLQNGPGFYATRDEALDSLKQAGFSLTVARWMVTNLSWNYEGYEWIFNVPVMTELMQSYAETDLCALLDHPKVPLHIVKALGSDTIPDSIWDLMKQKGKNDKNLILHELPGGHWLQQDNPDGLIQKILEYYHPQTSSSI